MPTSNEGQEPSGPTKSRPYAFGALQRSPHQTGKCPRICLQLGDVYVNEL